MKRYVSTTVICVVVAFLSIAIANISNAKGTDKIPITTSSAEAKKEFLQGRDLFEKLRAQNSIEHFQQAAAKDPKFAQAYFFLAQSAPSAKAFSDNMKKAVALASNASEGERLLIMGFQAAVDADQPKQQEYLEKLVTKYPGDERAHFALGTFYNGQQDYAKAVDHYKKCTQINADYSAAYNSLGYAYRAMENYDAAEKAFIKYTQLIPNDPNPFDSYAELLLKVGKFDKSIAEYKKALSLDPNFVSSRVGIAANLMYSGKPDDAAAELQKLYDMARNDGERRIAVFNMVVLSIDRGDMDQALTEADKEYAIAEKANDMANMSADLNMRANILREMGRYDEAVETFKKSLGLIQACDMTQGVKDNARLAQHFSLASVAIARKDLKTAKAEADVFRKGAEAIKNTFQIRQAHELAGAIALEEKNYDKAIAELQKANQLNPYNFYRLSLAYRGKNDEKKAREFCEKAAWDHVLPAINYAFIRTKAEKMLASM